MEPGCDTWRGRAGGLLGWESIGNGQLVSTGILTFRSPLDRYIFLFILSGLAHACLGYYALPDPNYRMSVKCEIALQTTHWVSSASHVEWLHKVCVSDESHQSIAEVWDGRCWTYILVTDSQMNCLCLAYHKSSDPWECIRKEGVEDVCGYVSDGRIGEWKFEQGG